MQVIFIFLKYEIKSVLSYLIAIFFLQKDIFRGIYTTDVYNDVYYTMYSTSSVCVLNCVMIHNL